MKRLDSETARTGESSLPESRPNSRPEALLRKSEVRDELDQLHGTMQNKVRRGAAIGFAAPMALILQAVTSWGAQWPQYGLGIFIALVAVAVLHLLGWVVDHRQASRLREELSMITAEELGLQIEDPSR